MTDIQFNKSSSSTVSQIAIVMAAGFIAANSFNFLKNDVDYHINKNRLMSRTYDQSHNGSTFDHAANPFTGEHQYENKNLFEGFDDYSFSGWDGEEAVPISELTLIGAKNLISKLPREFRYPDAAPGIDGSVCMEWLIGEAEIFIDFNSDGSILVYANINGKKYKNGFSRFDNAAFKYIFSVFQEV